MKKTALFLVAIFWLIYMPILLNAQDTDADGDGLNDDLEQALAIKYAPEWRFSKRTIYPDDFFLFNNSNQNEDFEDSYPCSVEYLIYGNQDAGDGLPQLRLKVNANGIDNYSYTDFNYINSIYSTSLTSFGVNPPITILSSEILCNGTPYEVCLSYKDGLYGEKYSFPTYFNCRKTANNSYIAISYFLFSPDDNKHETFSEWVADHRGDWEYFSVFIPVSSVNLNNGDIENSEVEWLKFFQHGGPKEKISNNSERLRWVNGTHPKMYVARTSHAIYPEPGILFDYHINSIIWPDLYDDIFIGNGLVVQSWNRDLVNVGGIENSSLSWAKYKGLWGCDDSPKGPICKLEQDDVDNLNVMEWETWITPGAGGYSQYWGPPPFNGTGFLYDCDVKFSTDYHPNPNYNCNQIIDCHRKCYSSGGILSEIGSDIHVWGSLLQAAINLPANQTWQVGIMPNNSTGSCGYPEPVIINKPMILKAIEGKVILGQ